MSEGILGEGGTVERLSTLVELLRFRAALHPGRTAFTFLLDGERQEIHVSYGELDLQARAIAARLRVLGVEGERALLLYPPGLPYVAAFFGCLYAGVVAVPVYPPRPNRADPRLLAILSDARARVVLTTSAILPHAVRLVRGGVSLLWVATDGLNTEAAEGWREPTIGPDTLAFLQYTSGSTSTPKGVMVSHRNLLHNERLIQRSFGVEPASIVVGWLPLYHDMGLIGNILQPLYSGCPAVLMSPLDFLQRPLRWLDALSRYGGTVSGGPNFAYDLCLRKIRTEEIQGLDLSRWRVAFNGAEPVRAETMESFAERFAPAGFRREAFFPCYGLAEATLFVTGASGPGGGAGEGAVVRRYSAAELAAHRAVSLESASGSGSASAPGAEEARTLASSGRILPEPEGTSVRIVDPETLAPRAEGEVGEIWLSGPSVARGYWSRPDLTESHFRARLQGAAAAPGDGRHLRTGDLGFLSGGELFVTGRAKDLIIIRGRNLYPQDVELAVEKCHPALRPGCGAAFSIEIGGEERLVVVQEVRRDARNADLDEVLGAMRRAVAEEQEAVLHAAVLIRTASLPKTSSGKVRRGACREAYLAGGLAVVAAWEADRALTGSVRLVPEEHDLSLEAGARAWLAAEVARRTGVSPGAIDERLPLTRYALDSLAAMEVAHAVEERLGVPVSIEAFFEGASVTTLIERVFAARAQAPAPTAPQLAERSPTGMAGLEGDLPLSYGQEALWLLHLLDPASPAYNVPAALTIEGEVDAEALRAAFQALLERHPALRSTFSAPAGDPVRRVAARAEISFSVENASRWSEETLRSRLDAEANRPFDLESGPLLRVHLFERSKLEHILLVVVHHITTDFWSQGLLLADLDALYVPEREGEAPPLAAPPLRYADFVRWQRDLLAGERREVLAAYWRGKLAGDLPDLDLPADRPRPPVQTFVGATRRLRLPAGLSARLAALARRAESTLFATLLAAFKVLLHRYSRQTDVAVGSPTTGRSLAGFASVVGYFVNPVVLRDDLKGNPTFLALLGGVRRTVLGALEHQDYPFPLLVEELRPERDPSRSPLFQAMFVLQKAPALRGQDLTPFALNETGAHLTVAGLPLVSRQLEERFAQFDLTLTMGFAEDRLAAAFNYNTDLFDADTIARLARHFETLLAGIEAQPEIPLSDLPLLTEAERYRLLVTWNHTRASYPHEATIPVLFEAQADQTPACTAVVYRERELVYRELERAANRLAHHLRARGVGSGELVGICLERSPELIVALLAVLKAGAAYLPLDPEVPSGRNALLLADAGVDRVVTEGGLRRRLPAEIEAIEIDTESELIAAAPESRPAITALAEEPACAIYTSGSTGRPKGVLLTHRNLANLIVSFIRSYSPDVQDRLLPLTSVASASFVGEVFPILCADGALVLPDREEILDTGKLIELILRHQVTILSTVPSLIATLNAMKEELPKLRLILAGGEALTVGDVDRILESATVVNGYGLTETSICSTSYQVGLADLQANVMLPIGRPLMNHQLYILDDELALLPIGSQGNLYIGGDGVARGYLRHPALTAERFVPDPFEPGRRMYRTGDLASWRADGTVLFHGRVDHQVKVRGHRIELGEIETVLGLHRQVREAVVVPREGEKGSQRPGEKRLVAYFVANPGQGAEAGEGPTTGDLLAYLRTRLPDYMVPADFVALPELPLLANGKVDLRALPEPERVRPELRAAYAAPKSELERIIASVWQDALEVDKVGIHDNFFDLGGHSLLLAKVHARLKESLAREISLVELFRNPTVSSLAAALAAEGSAQAPNVASRAPRRVAGFSSGPQAADRDPRGDRELAIVGLAGRFPGAKTIDAFWRMLREGREAIRFFSDEELLAAGVDPELLKNPDYVKAKGSLGDVDQFDAGLFGLAPREVELMDPQHRLFLECAWEALERAGYNSGRISERVGRVGVFGGESMNTYLITNLISHLELVASAETLQASLGNDKDPLTSRVSYKLNLKGPSITIQSASSTSLTAVHVACQSLLNRDCDMALAGGVSIHLPEISGYMFHEGGTTAPDGHCRAFDAKARGFVSGHGCGVVVLRRLSDALRDGDHIHAVIKGTACNNDGALKVSYTAPSVDGQVEVYTAAYEHAGISPDSLSYIECHGTATPMGDPIEIAALTQAFRAHTDRKNFCAIGSLKTNVGHLDSAAGVCGLIKAALALENREIPASLHFERPNPQIDFANSPFFVNSTLREWRTQGAPRRAGVTSLGMGGTNAHVILEEAPPLPPSGPSRRLKLLLQAAHTENALETATSELASYLEAHPLLDLADVCFTLQQGRRPFVHRRALLAADLEDAATALASRDPERLLTVRQEAGDRPVVFLFTGQGSQYPNMTRGLYESEPVFKAEVDRCSDLLRLHLGLDLRTVLFPPPGDEEQAAERLRQTSLSQPALFVVEYALAMQWMEWGVRPQAMLGHSIGEYVAAALAEVFPLRDALALVAARGRMMQRLPGGSMLAVPLSEAEALPLLGAELSLAAVNRPNLVVVAGPAPAIEALRSTLAARGIDGRLLHTSHAFHSAMMDPILEPFVERVKKVKLSPPRLPYISNVTGTWIRPEQATDPRYWAAHLRSAVRFAEGAAELLAEPSRVFLEIGPGNALATLVRQHPARRPEQPVLASVRHPREVGEDDGFLLTTLAHLWLAGVEIDWSGFHAHERRRRVPLPTYPFQRQRYWVEPRKDAAVGRGRDQVAGKRLPADRWFYTPVWKRLRPVRAAVLAAGSPGAGACLVFADEEGLGVEVARKLASAGRTVFTVRPGEALTQMDDTTFAVDGYHPAGYEALLAEIDRLGHRVSDVVHLWNVSHAAPAEAAALENGFFSLTFLAQGLAKRSGDAKLQILVVSTGLQRVTGDEDLHPEKAVLLGPVRVIPRELPGFACRSLDLELPKEGSSTFPDLARRVIAELAELAGRAARGEREAAGDESSSALALRGSFRWLQETEPAELPAPLEAPIEGRPSGRLRRRGVYLLTGGLGGLALETARGLARRAAARLVLVGRSALPERAGWEAWIAEHGEDDAVSRRLRAVLELEELGAEVLTLQADVTDPDAMEAVRGAALARFGAIHGVLHAAGVPGGGLVLVKSRAAAEAVLAPKVRGTLVLERVFGDLPLDFLVLFSSNTSLLAQPGQVDYAAANSFLDAFAQSRTALGAWTAAIGWDAWNEAGMALEVEVPAELRAWREQELALGLTSEEGVDALFRVLAGDEPWTLVSTHDLPSRLRSAGPGGAIEQIEKAAEARPTHPRPLLANAYVAPRSEEEGRIAEIWQNLLGIDPVGIHDNFFDLGGNSLMAIRVIAKLKSELGADVSEVSIFEGPTVAGLARLLAVRSGESGEDGPDAVDDRRDRGERRRAARRGRRGLVEVG